MYLSIEFRVSKLSAKLLVLIYPAPVKTYAMICLGLVVGLKRFCNLIAKPSQYNVQKNHFENKNWKNFNKKKSQFDKNFKNNNNVYRSEYELPPEVYLISF